jgi:sugar/nucleoside kinase (ribokinase family)
MPQHRGTHRRSAVPCYGEIFVLPKPRSTDILTDFKRQAQANAAVVVSVVAGDALCAGCLYGMYHQFSGKSLLEFASAAACNLFAVNSVNVMRSKDEILKMEKQYGRR